MDIKTINYNVNVKEDAENLYVDICTGAGEADKYLGALATFNADPFIVEDDETAEAIAKSVANAPLAEITDEGERETAAAKLDGDTDHLHRIYTNGEVTVCLANDWELA